MKVVKLAAQSACRMSICEYIQTWLDKTLIYIGFKI